MVSDMEPYLYQNELNKLRSTINIAMNLLNIYYTNNANTLLCE